MRAPRRAYRGQACRAPPIKHPFWARSAICGTAPAAPAARAAPPRSATARPAIGHRSAAPRQPDPACWPCEPSSAASAMARRRPLTPRGGRILAGPGLGSDRIGCGAMCAVRPPGRAARLARRGPAGCGAKLVIEDSAGS